VGEVRELLQKRKRKGKRKKGKAGASTHPHRTPRKEVAKAEFLVTGEEVAAWVLEISFLRKGKE